MTGPDGAGGAGGPDGAGGPGGVEVVTLLTRRECPLCDTAAAAVARICGELTVPWRAVDVDHPDAVAAGLRAEYGDRVPVVLIDGREHGYWAVEEDRFRAALARRGDGPVTPEDRG